MVNAKAVVLLVIVLAVAAWLAYEIIEDENTAKVGDSSNSTNAGKMIEADQRIEEMNMSVIDNGIAIDASYSVLLAC